MTSHSLTTGDETDMDLLYPILAAALDKQQDLDVVAADTSIIFDFLHRHERLPDPIHDSIVIDVRERGGPPAERVGWISEVDAVNDGDHTAVINSENSITDNPHGGAISISQFAVNSNHPSRPVEPSQSSSDIANCVKMLESHYETKGLAPAQYVSYGDTIPLGDDQFATAVWLRDYSPAARFDGNGTGKHGAKEAAARKALRGLGVLESV